MKTLCYTWDNCPYSWVESPFTWKEGCVLEKIMSVVVPGSIGISRELKKKRRITLKDDEKKTLIDLFLRLEIDGLIIEKRMNKFKNKQVKIKLKDLKISYKEQKKVKVDVKIDNI